MDIPPTQVFEDNDFIPTQKLSISSQHEANKEEIQIGVLSIGTDTYPIKEGINKIGRHPGCNIILNDQTVSKNHAEIEANSGESSAWICDLNSSNKTKLNNTILRPGRCYELKDGNVVEFGMVRAVYKVCRTLDDSLIPETPAPNRQKQQKTVIPGTPDSSLNNSSTLGDNVSMVPGTQAGDEEAVFRRPSLPQRSSTCSRRSFIHDSSLEDNVADSQRSTHGKKHVGEPRVSIRDMETQKSFEAQNETDVDIHDVETQKICLSSIRALGKALSAQQVDIHDVETQHDEDIETEARITDIHDIDTQHEDVDIHDMKTPRKVGIQNISVGDSNDTTQDYQKSKLEETELTTENENNLCDIETQKIEAGENKSSPGDVNSHKDEHIKVSSEITLTEDEAVTTCTEQAKNVQRSSQECLQLSLATNFDDECSELDRSRNLLGSQNLLEDYLTDDDPSDETKSKPSTPMKTSLPSNETTEKSTDEENIFDAATQAKDDSENMFEAVTQRINYPLKASLIDDDSDDTDQEAVFQRYSRIDSQDSTQPAKSQQSADSEDSDTDEEGRFTEVALKEKRASCCSFEAQKNESKEVKNDGGVSKDSDDLFETATQHVNVKNKESSTKEAEVSKTSIDSDIPTQIIVTNKLETGVTTEEDTKIDDIDDLAPTQIISTNESPAKMSEPSINLTTKETAVDEKEDITEMEDNTAIQLLSLPEKDPDASDNESPKAMLLEQGSIEDIDYEMAPTQLVAEVERKKSASTGESGKNISTKTKKVSLDDTLERNLKEMFDGVNEEHLEEQPHMSTQVLTSMLQSSQCGDKFIDKPSEDSRSPDIGKVKKSSRGRKSKLQVASVEPPTPDKKSRKSSLKTVVSDTGSQHSETYFSGLTSTRKRNILRDSQDSGAPVGNMSDSKKEEKLATTSETVDTVINQNNSVSDVSLRFTPKSSSTPRMSRRHKTEESKVGESIAEETKDLPDSEKDVSKESSEKAIARKSVTPIRISTVLENDEEEDIMASLPEVKIAGTLSNPASPTSSTSTEFRLNADRIPPKRGSKAAASKRRAAPQKPLQKSVTRKKAENAEPYRAITKPDSSTISSKFGDSDVDKTPMQVHESDEEEVNKTFRRTTRKIPPKNSQNSKASKSVTQQISVPSVDTQDQAIHSPSTQSIGRTRNSSKENVDRSSVFQVGKEAPVSNAESAKRTTLNALRAEKRSLNTTEMNESVNAKKRREEINEGASTPTRGRKSNAKNAIINRSNSANILDYMAKRNSPVNVETSNSTKLSLSQPSVCSKQLLIKVARMSPCSPTEPLSPRTHSEPVIENIVSTETKKGRRASVNKQSTLKALANTENETDINNIETRRNTSQRASRRKKPAEDISSQVGEESQEVEMIMSNKIFQVQTTTSETEKKRDTNETKEGMRTRNTRKRGIANIHTDTDSTTSSDICESDNTHFEMPASKAKRAKISKNTSNTADSTINESAAKTKRNSRQPSRSTRSHQQSITDSSVEEPKEISTSQISVNNTASQVSNTKTRGMKRKTETQAGKKQNKDIIEETSSSEINSSFDNASVTSTPRTRRSMPSSFSASSPFKVKHKILFTGIPSNDYNKLLTKLGASQVEDPTKCTVLVTDKVRRTLKFLCALAQSVPIVSVDWLVESEKAGHFVELENYILKDPAAEAKFGFKLRGSLEKAKNHKLLEGYTIVLTPNVAPPPLPELKSIISSCGGKPLVRPPPSWPQKAVIISCETDLANAKKFLAKAPKAVTVQSTELLLTGILRQELDFVKYKLT